MSDLEVEKTLREIRERVLADAQRRVPATTTNGVMTATANGAEPAVASRQAGQASEALARMDANLTTTARAWSRLPPLLTYRRGAAARFELWLKRLIKRAVHWFTWEQLNFNSAVHHALGDARAALAAQEHALATQEQALATQEQALAAQKQALLAAQEHALFRLREEMTGELRLQAEANRVQLAGLHAQSAELQARLVELHARLAHAESQVAEAQTRFESGGAQLRQVFAEGLERVAESQRVSTDELREGQLSEVRARAAELHAEMRERIDGLLEEQRVCFKQLSLEAGEAAVMHDRARRQLEARLETLEGKQSADGSRQMAVAPRDRH